MGAWLKRNPRRVEIIVGIIVVVLIGIRLALPAILLRVINHRLADIGPYSGHVQDVGIHVLHGGYSMGHLVIRKVGGTSNEPFVLADDITFTVSYHDLLRGHFTSNIVITRGGINFENSAAPQTQQNLGSEKTAKGAPKPSRSWQDAVTDLFPLKIGHLEMVHSQIHYRDKTATPQINLSIDDLSLTANGLQNRPDPKAGPLPATITANGSTIGGGHFHLVIHIAPLASEPHFDLRLAVEQIDLTQLNPFLLSSANVDVGKGTLALYAEINAVNGNFKGYIKPLLTNLDFHDHNDEKKSPVQLIWKDMVAAVTRLLRDRTHKQVATIVPISGQFSHTETVGVGPTIRTLFYNGFIQALAKGLEANPAAAEKGK
ncbi:MAG TPA: DUF748 domain-containing protein [Opitutaceae bacterium]|jgi:hypothetical protein